MKPNREDNNSQRIQNIFIKQRVVHNRHYKFCIISSLIISYPNGMSTTAEFPSAHDSNLPMLTLLNLVFLLAFS